MKNKESADLFDYSLKKEISLSAPLAARMRPVTLVEFEGQSELLNEKSVLSRAIKDDYVTSIIFWGPPGCGKTTLSRIIAKESKAKFFPLSAVSAGVADLRKVIAQAREIRALNSQRTIMFIDEIHRFNKAQQDAVLPFVENGLVTLIGATTENPSFEVNSALLSRCRVYVLHALSEKDIENILKRALSDNEKGLGKYNAELTQDAWKFILTSSQGDARVALNSLEYAVVSANIDESGKRIVTLDIMEDALQHRAMLYDKNGEEHYDLISALHKSMRNSEPSAALYWLGRMLEGGEDPLYIVRRVARFASEDIGLADPNALVQAINAFQAVHFIGLPEANLAIAQAVVYMSLAPKSNALYAAMTRVKKDIKTERWYPVPKHIRNAVTKLMKEEGYGKGYKYAHDYEDGITDMSCLPEEIKDRTYFNPSKFGWESKACLRLEELRNSAKQR